MVTIESLVLLRQTVTGNFNSQVYLVEDTLKIVEPDGDRHTVEPGSVILVLQEPCVNCLENERLLDAAELMLHAHYSIRNRGVKVETPFDIRSKLARMVAIGDEDVPF